MGPFSCLTNSPNSLKIAYPLRQSPNYLRLSQNIRSGHENCALISFVILVIFRMSARPLFILKISLFFLCVKSLHLKGERRRCFE